MVNSSPAAIYPKVFHRTDRVECRGWSDICLRDELKHVNESVGMDSRACRFNFEWSCVRMEVQWPGQDRFSAGWMAGWLYMDIGEELGRWSLGMNVWREMIR